MSRIGLAGRRSCAVHVGLLGCIVLASNSCDDGTSLSAVTTGEDQSNTSEASSTTGATTATSNSTRSSGTTMTGSTSGRTDEGTSRAASTQQDESTQPVRSTGGTGVDETEPASGSTEDGVGSNEETSTTANVDPTSAGESATEPSSSGNPGDPLAVKPSAGCTAGGETTPEISNAILGLPEAYDGQTPGPAIFAFHAAGNPSTQLQSEYGNTVLGQNYVMIYGAAMGGTGGWNLQADKGRFDTMFEQLLARVCVDENRIFATGHSSGAQFIVQLLCDGETRFRAVAPVASSSYCASFDAAVPALVMHGQNDMERAGVQDADGAKDFAQFKASNSCGESSTPSDVDVQGCSDSIEPNCLQYEACTEPTIWCQHNDPNYGGTQHGIPCFAESAMHDFFGRF